MPYEAKNLGKNLHAGVAAGKTFLIPLASVDSRHGMQLLVRGFP